jgi:hypothetical protein
MSEQAKNEVPSLAHVLGTLAYHVTCIMTGRPSRTDPPYSERDQFGLGLGAYGEGCPLVRFDVEIRPSDENPWGPWAQVHLAPIVDGVRGRLECHGNRSGGREAYVNACAPVIQWVADYWAAKAKG